ncbi:MAG: hypothetical protein ACI97A_002047 [Planctomycetota bacterium]|jgi:hypothetical protein
MAQIIQSNSAQVNHQASALPLTTVSMVRNEADIVEAFIRHHLCLVDRMVIILHRPDVPNLLSDNTEEILEELRAEGLPIELTVFEEARYAQRELVTNAVREAAKKQGEGWVLPLDADEFVVSPANIDLKDVLRSFDSSKAQQMPWRTYVPTENDDSLEANPACRIQHRRVRETVRTNKIIVPAKLAAHDRSKVSQGSHRFKISKDALNVECDELSLAHIPIRTVQQIRTKVFHGWLNDLVHRYTTDDRVGVHWQRLYKELSVSDSVTVAKLRDLALDYVSPGAPDEDRSLIHDPIATIDKKLRYERRPIDPWAMLASDAESMAKSLGIKKRNSFLPWRSSS